MTITRLNPSELHETPGYHHVTVVESGRLAFIAGQCPLDWSGALVGQDDVVAQVDQVAANAATALAAAGGRRRAARARRPHGDLRGGRRQGGARRRLAALRQVANRGGLHHRCSA